MKFLILESKDPYLNLAIEEYFFDKNQEEVFILWQNQPVVVIGKNQNAYAEINQEFLKARDIKVARRITGGGAVYHDLGCVNYTYISNQGNGGIDFKTFTAPIIKILSKIVSAEVVLSGRNDIMIDNKKISGNAQHTKGKRVLHHGTLLFDSELDVLSNALNVDPDKIESKAIKSVRSRVANIRDYLIFDMPLRDFIRRISEGIIREFSPEIISAPECKEVEDLARRNASFEWIFSESKLLSQYTVKKKQRFSFGTVNAFLEMKNDFVAEVSIEGDFFGVLPIEELEIMLKSHTLDEMKDIINNIDPSLYIHGMGSSDLYDLIFS